MLKVCYGAFHRFSVSRIRLSGNEDNGDDPPAKPSSASADESGDRLGENEKELLEFSKKATEMSTSDLDRDLVETRHDIEFLEAQIKVDASSFTSDDLERANARIELLRRKVDIMEKEFYKRSTQK